MRDALSLLAVMMVSVVVVGTCGCGGGNRAVGMTGGNQMHTAAHENLKPGFSFLPPLGEPVTGSAALNTDAQPVVEILAGSWADKGANLVTFEGSAIATQGDGFQVSWDTAAATGGLPPGTAGCVIVVSWDGVPLGYVDCQIDRTNGRGRTAADPEFFGLQDGRTLPIKFSIARSLEVIGAAGGTLQTANGAVTLSIPSGALTEPTPISVEPRTLAQTCNRVAPGAAYEFGPDGTEFAQPVQLTIHFDPSNPPEYGLPSLMRLLKNDNGYWVNVEGSTLDQGASTVTGQIHSFSQYSAGVPMKVAWVKISGNAGVAYVGNADGTETPQAFGAAYRVGMSGRGNRVA